MIIVSKFQFHICWVNAFLNVLNVKAQVGEGEGPSKDLFHDCEIFG